jgi:hypothetical protein
VAGYDTFAPFQSPKKTSWKAVEIPNSSGGGGVSLSLENLKFGAFVFWNAGIIHTEFMHLGTIIEMNTYYNML